MKNKLIVIIGILWLAVIASLVYLGMSVNTSEPKYAGEDRLVGLEVTSGVSVSGGSALSAPGSDVSDADSDNNQNKIGKTNTGKKNASTESDQKNSVHQNVKNSENQNRDNNKSKDDSNTKSNKNNNNNSNNKSKEKTCNFTIECKRIVNRKDLWRDGLEEFIPAKGVFFSGKIKVNKKQTVYDILKKICKENNILLDAKYTPLYETYYVAGIGNIYEFDCGAESGWKYSVNGKLPGVGCSRYTVSAGDNVVFFYDITI
ncbi:MAG: DUF4430 domain-containing protein [Eubacterium sp.]|nr:DUF4430 domain-containing protein [Eubacterium sp.]